MSSAPQKDLLTRLADAGEDAINRLSDLPGASKLLDATNTLRARVDELQKRMRGIEELEQRVTALEAQLAALTKTAKPKAAKPAASPASKPKPASSS
jgi:hypothetical protein